MYEFAADKIHQLLYGYDKGYADLLINIFEQVLTAALGCFLSNRNIRALNISPEDVQSLYKDLSGYDNHTLWVNINKAAKDMFEEVNITNYSLRRYIERSLPKIVFNIKNALELNTLSKVFITSLNPDVEDTIQFESAARMDDEDYRSLVEELLRCRYLSDKVELIKQEVKSFDDLDDILLDAQLNEEELTLLFNTLGDVEIAELVKRHPFDSQIQAVDLSEAEQMVRSCLKNMLTSSWLKGKNIDEKTYWRRFLNLAISKARIIIIKTVRKQIVKRQDELETSTLPRMFLLCYQSLYC